MPIQTMCIERLASIQFERSDQAFNPARRLIFSQILHKSAVTTAEIVLRSLANRLSSWKHAARGSPHL